MVLVNNSRWFGGAEVYLEQLLKAGPPGLAFTLATRDTAPRRLGDSAVSTGAPVVLWRPRPAGLWRLYQEIRRARVVHLNMAWNGDNAHALALAWLCRVPLVATVHIWVQPGSEWRRRVMSLGYRRFDRVIAVSAEIEAAVGSQLGVSGEVLTVVRNGVPVHDPVVREPHDGVVIGGLGRLEPAKGFDLLIEAVRRLRAQGHPVEAVIGGEGSERGRLETAADGLPVRFVGFVTDGRAFLAGVDVFCMPSRWEGLPFALLEAMMAGTACVASDVGDVAMALDEVGRVVPPGDVDALTAVLGELVASPELRDELAAAAHLRARSDFGLQASVARTAAVYAEAEAEAVTRRGSRTPSAGAAPGPPGPGAAQRRPTQ